MVTLLTAPDGEPFTTGAMTYLYQPATPVENTSRILLPVRIENVFTIAALDTGAPFGICPPRLARQLALDPATALEPKTMLIRGSWVTGSLHRLQISFPAEEGEDLQIDATLFVPTVDWEEGWGDLPCFIGMVGCLERMRFAVDPGRDQFYFGPVP